MKERKWKHRHPQKAFPRAERKEQIMGQFAIWERNKDTEPKTMNRIAKALGMSPAQTVTDMLLELVAEGKLGFTERAASGRWTGRDYYSNVRTLITEKYGKRRVSVKRRGQVVGSLEVPAGQLGLWS